MPLFFILNPFKRIGQKFFKKFHCFFFGRNDDTVPKEMDLRFYFFQIHKIKGTSILKLAACIKSEKKVTLERNDLLGAVKATCGVFGQISIIYGHDSSKQ